MSGISAASGKHAEALAADYLNAAGMKFVEKNYHCRYGEIDLIFRDTRNATSLASAPLVFVEVRYRRSARFGDALESVNHHKQRKIHLTASHYLQNQSDTLAARFDLVAISGDLTSPYIDWFEDIEIRGE